MATRSLGGVVKPYMHMIIVALAVHDHCSGSSFTTWILKVLRQFGLRELLILFHILIKLPLYGVINEEVLNVSCINEALHQLPGSFHV